MSAQREDVAGGDTPKASIPEPTPAAQAANAAQAHPGTHVPLLNIANVLTVARIAIVPVFLWALFADGGHSTEWRIAAFVLFAIASVTDRVDGQLARKYGLVTDFGKLADPIADKALIGAALVGLSVLGDLSWWVTVVIGVRELGITVLRFSVLRHGVIPASRGGKLKTLVQAFAIGFYLLPLPAALEVVSATLMAAAIVLTLATGIDYVVQSIRLRSHVGLHPPHAR